MVLVPCQNGNHIHIGVLNESLFIRTGVLKPITQHAVSGAGAGSSCNSHPLDPANFLYDWQKHCIGVISCAKNTQSHFPILCQSMHLGMLHQGGWQLIHSGIIRQQNPNEAFPGFSTD